MTHVLSPIFSVLLMFYKEKWKRLAVTADLSPFPPISLSHPATSQVHPLPFPSRNCETPAGTSLCCLHGRMTSAAESSSYCPPPGLRVRTTQPVRAVGDFGVQPHGLGQTDEGQARQAGQALLERHSLAETRAPMKELPPGKAQEAATVTQGTLTCSASLLMRDNPSSAELSQPLVNTRSNPREIRVSSATRGSCTMSKAERSMQQLRNHSAHHAQALSPRQLRRQ